MVHQRTALLLSFKSLYARTTGQPMSLSRLKSMELKETKRLYEHPANCLIATVQKEHIEQLDQSLERIEKAVLKSAVQKARLGRDEELGALQRLDQQARKLEHQARGPSVPALIAEDEARSHSYGGRSVFGWEPPPADEQTEPSVAS